MSFSGLSDWLIHCGRGAPDAVSQCRTAGIKVIMITGDYPATARAIAGQIGLDANEVLTGEDVNHLTHRSFRQRSDRC